MATRRFASPNIMQQFVDMYFDEREIDGKPPTLSGLALYLGFNSLGALRKYQGYDNGDFQDVINGARLRIMDTLETLVMQGKPGVQFLLKNMDKEEWRDRTEQSVDVKDERMMAMTEAERMNRLEAMIQRVRQEKVVESIPHEEEEDDGTWME